MNDKPKYIFASTVSSFIAPVVVIVWFFISYSFENADGTPDNGPIRAAPVIVLLGVFAFLFQLVAYAVVGRFIYKQSIPSIKPGAIYAAVSPIPLVVLIYLKIAAAYRIDPQSNTFTIDIALYFYCFLWICCMSGALVQLWLVRKHARPIL